jgi:hypothetical protein
MVIDKEEIASLKKGTDLNEDGHRMEMAEKEATKADDTRNYYKK